MARTVLLADDSVTAQNMGRRILTDAGYDVITVNNGSAALKKIHEARPDLIVLDVYMPGYGGLEVCQRLKESGETMRIPVLLSVGKMEPFKADEAKRVRADAHIVKPFEASELLAALAKLEDRIVPQADSANGRKRKPSFWHGEDDTAAVAQRDWTESAAYLAQAKQRKGDAPAVVPESAQDQPVVTEETPEVAAFPLVPPATEEMAVIAESLPSVVSPDESAQQRSASSEPSSRDIAEAADVATATGNVKATQSPEEIEALEGSSAGPAGAVDVTASVPSNGRWIAENVALTAEEAALELDREMSTAEAAESVQSAGAPAIKSETQEETQGATFAAAAGAGSSAVATTAGTAGDESEPPVPSEAAAAWQNWQHIRETVMNGQTAAAIVETVAQAAKATPPQETSPTEPSSPESPSSSGMEAGALASIVDSVLAELKPKLMEEIAKKLKK